MNLAAFICRGLYRFRPSKITGDFISWYISAKSGWRNSFHSVMIASASAPSRAAVRLIRVGQLVAVDRPGRCSIASGSWTFTLAPRAEQPVDQHQGRGFADVVGPRLERQAPDGDRSCRRACRRSAR